MPWSGPAAAAISLAALAAPIAPVSGQCEPRWSEEFEAGDIDGTVWDLEWFDDGSGPALYAAGVFSAAGGAEASGIARWNGESWSSVGGGVDGYALALSVYDDGTGPALFVAGNFTAAGGLPVGSNAAKWDGQAWTPLPGDTDRSIAVMEVFDGGAGPRLYFGGNFARAGGVEATRVAQWDGEVWSAVGSGTSGVVRAMAVFDDGSGPALFVAGQFTTAGGVSVEHLAKWSGEAWESAPAPPYGFFSRGIWELMEWDDGAGSALFATGRFEDAAGATGGVVRLRDGNWEVFVGSPIAPYLPFGLGPIEVDGKLGMGAAASDRVGVWIDGAWKELGAIRGPGSTDGRVLLQVETAAGRRTYLGGNFTSIGGVHVRGLAAWDGHEWAALTPPRGVGGAVFAILANGARAYVGGAFLSAGAIMAARVAAYEADTWSPLGPGFTFGTGCHGAEPYVLSLTELPVTGGSDLIAGGSIADAGGRETEAIARWDGDAWRTMGDGLPLRSCADCCADVRDMVVFDDGSGPALYAAGWFDTPASGVARWDGERWAIVGGHVGLMVNALQPHDDGSGAALYVAGLLLSPLGAQVVRWDGAAWSDVGAGPGFFPEALAEFDEGGRRLLVAGGGLGDDGAVSRWDGASWVRMGGLFDGPVHALAVFDDGRGAALYAGGEFTSHEGRAVRGLARWDGAEWREAHEGVNGAVYAMEPAPYDGAWSLLIGGYFSIAGGEVASGNIARLVGCAAVCYPDCDGDGELTFLDFLCFQNEFAAMTSYADCDASGAHDFFDFLCFQNAFAAGCP